MMQNIRYRYFNTVLILYQYSVNIMIHSINTKMKYQIHNINREKD